jgi:hypothetical protein
VPGVPASLILAGARAVLASPGEVPGPALDAFFGEVQGLVGQGLRPAVALQRTRERWLGPGGPASDVPAGGWVDQLLAFDDGS